MIKKEEFTIDSRDGKTALHAVKWLPETEPVCILQIIHGMNDYIQRYEEMAQYFAGKGILVVGDDHLGHGSSVSKGGQYGYICETDGATVMVRDEHRLKKTIQQQYPGVPYLIFGHSMGSFILRNYLIRYGSGIDGAIICGTGNPAKWQLVAGKFVTTLLGKLRGDHYVSGFVANMTSKAYMKVIENPRTCHDWICSDPKVVDAYAKDPQGGGFTFSVNAYHVLYELADRMQNKKELAKMPKKLPVLIVSGTEDPVGERGKAPQKLYDDFLNLDMTKVTFKLYNGCRHELYNEPVKETFFLDLENWISLVLVQRG